MPLPELRLRTGERQTGASSRGEAMAPIATAPVNGNFEALVSSCGDELLAFANRVLAGTNGAEDVDAGDALQEGLLRYFRQYGDDFPADPREARRHLFRAVKLGAYDAIRRWHHQAKVRVVATDLEAVDELCAEVYGGDTQIRDEYALRAARAVRDLAEANDHADAVVDAHVLELALAALEPLEYEVIVRQPARRDELAAELGVSENQVRNALHSGRKLARTLIEHASGAPLSEPEREDLFALLDGQISDRKRRRDAQRHLDNCPACQQIAERERRINALGARIFMPLPVLLGLAKPLAAAGAGAAGSASAAGGSGSAATSSGGGLLATIGGGSSAKIAAFVAVAAAAGGGGAAVKAASSERPVKPKAAAVAAAPTAAATVTAAKPVLFSKISAAHAASPKPKHRPRPQRRHVAPKAAIAAAPSPAPAPVPTPAPATAAPATPAPASQPKPAPSSNGNGGEFVLGGGH